MIRRNNTAKNMKRLNNLWLLPTLMLLMSLMSFGGCRPRLQVVSAERVVVPMKANASYAPPVDGVFMSTALYQDLRRAVADQTLQMQMRAGQGQTAK